MRYIVISGLCLLLGACVVSPPAHEWPEQGGIPETAPPCEKPGNGRCSFRNAPAALSPKPVLIKDHPRPFFRTQRSLAFTDARAKRWVAPRGTLTDGTALPEIFLPITGNPRDPAFIGAATLHDAYCGAGNSGLAQYHSDSWQNVHRMFHDALRAGGIPARKAMILYAAVYIGGPRWYRTGTKPDAYSPMPGVMVLELPIAPGSVSGPLAGTLPDRELVALLREAIGYIERTDPSLDQLDAFMRLKERQMLDRLRMTRPARIRDAGNIAGGN